LHFTLQAPPSVTESLPWHVMAPSAMFAAEALQSLAAENKKYQQQL
jgi:hypothetical protein